MSAARIRAAFPASIIVRPGFAAISVIDWRAIIAAMVATLTAMITMLRVMRGVWPVTRPVRSMRIGPARRGISRRRLAIGAGDGRCL